MQTKGTIIPLGIFFIMIELPNREREVGSIRYRIRVIYHYTESPTIIAIHIF
ncbi:MAG: hypothetical protein ACJ71X_07095 [Nitrososphaeraceae archaeon]